MHGSEKYRIAKLSLPWNQINFFDEHAVFKISFRHFVLNVLNLNFDELFSDTLRGNFIVWPIWLVVVSYQPIIMAENKIFKHRDVSSNFITAYVTGDVGFYVSRRWGAECISSVGIFHHATQYCGEKRILKVKTRCRDTGGASWSQEYKINLETWRSSMIVLPHSGKILMQSRLKLSMFTRNE